MDDETIEEMIAVAEAAGDEWSPWAAHRIQIVGAGGVPLFNDADECSPANQDHAEHIARFDPPTALRLLRELQNERRNHAEAVADRLHWRGRANRAEDGLRREQEGHAATREERNAEDLRARTARHALVAAEARAEMAEAESAKWKRAAIDNDKDREVAEARADEEARSLMARLDASHAALAALASPASQVGPLCWCIPARRNLHKPACLMARAALSPQDPPSAPTPTTDTPDNQRGPQTGAEGGS